MACPGPWRALTASSRPDYFSVLFHTATNTETGQSQINHIIIIYNNKDKLFHAINIVQRGKDWVYWNPAAVWYLVLQSGWLPLHILLMFFLLEVSQCKNAHTFMSKVLTCLFFDKLDWGSFFPFLDFHTSVEFWNEQFWTSHKICPYILRMKALFE